MLNAMRLTPCMIGATLIPAALLLAAGGARAGEQFTPPTHVSADEDVFCRVLNTSATPHFVEIQVRDGLGNSVPQNTCFPGANPFKPFVQPGDVSLLRCPGPGPRYCRFKVIGVASTAIRGMMEVRQDGTQAVIVAIPAE